MKLSFLIIAGLLAVAGCTHRADVIVRDGDAPPQQLSQNRNQVAAATCDAQAAPDRSNYLSAVQNLTSQASQSGADTAAARASLDQFREEVNAAYLNVVMRCKTHMHCLEVNSYNEARCYMAATDRKDAERGFGDLAYQLRDLEREVRLADIDARARSKAKPPKVTVETNVTQSVEQEQRVGDDIEDQDVLVVCGVKKLLARECRERCTTGSC